MRTACRDLNGPGSVTRFNVEGLANVVGNGSCPTSAQRFHLRNRQFFYGLLLLFVFGSGLPLAKLTAAELQYPLAVVAAADGSVYIADRNLPGIWKLAGEEVKPFFTGSKTFRTPLNAVRCLALDRNGLLLAGDSATREIYRFSADGQPTPLTTGGVGIPMAITLTADGNLVVSDVEIQRLVEVPAAGGPPKIVASINGVRGLATDSQGRIWAASNGGTDALVRFSRDWSQREVLVAGQPFEFSHHLVLGTDDETAYLVDGYGKTVWKIGADRKPEKLVESGLKNPVGLCWKGSDLLVADPHLKQVLELSPTGALRVLPGLK